VLATTLRFRRQMGFVEQEHFSGEPPGLHLGFPHGGRRSLGMQL